MEKTRQYPCEECGEVLSSSSGHIQHLLSHRGVTVFCCEACEEVFLSESQLNQHLDKHRNGSNKKFKCELCDKRFFKKVDLRGHTLMHYGVKEFKCEVCGKEFSSRSSYSQHSKVHSEVRDYECDQCGMKFKWRSNLMRHRKKKGHNIKHKCRVCGKMFNQKVFLAHHLQKCHNSTRRQIVSKSNIKALSPVARGEEEEEELELETLTDMHEKVNIKTETTLDIKRVVQTSTEKKRVSDLARQPNMDSEVKFVKKRKKSHFRCLVCNKEFNSRKGMLGHSKVHSDVREYECDRCGMQFKWRSNLNRHLLNHCHMRKRHRCPKCGRCYDRKSHLNAHLNTRHLGIKKYR